MAVAACATGNVRIAKRKLTGWQPRPDGVPLVLDRAYGGDETRQLVLQLGFAPVVPPKPSRCHPWTYDRPDHQHELG